MDEVIPLMIPVNYKPLMAQKQHEQEYRPYQYTGFKGEEVFFM